MQHHLVPVNFLNLMDAIGIADERGGRIRLSDQNAVWQFASRHQLDLGQGQMYSMSEGLPMATIIDSGLMEGFYLYDADTERSYRYLVTHHTLRPLRTYSKTMAFDVALSYSSESRGDAEKLQEALKRRCVRAYWLDVAEDPGEPLWGIRFREAVFHSYFFSPILTRHYLAREGTAVELFDLARLTVKHRGDEFFYPLLPLVEDPDHLNGIVFSERGDVARKYDQQDFEWARTHILSLDLSAGFDWMARFFASLAQNARNVWDSGFLDCLAPKIEYIELFRRPGQPGITFLIKSPALTYHFFTMNHLGIVSYMGMGEPQPNMECLRGHPDPAGRILSHLGLQRREGGPASVGPRPVEDSPKSTSGARILPFPGKRSPQ